MKILPMKKLLMLFSLLLSLSLSGLAWALTLDEAKARGLVGEKVDGYIGAVTASPGADVQALIASTNEGRRQVYLDLARRNGITVEAVGIVSAEKLRDKAAPGEYVQSTSGQWQKK
jgi:hypothetical protein